MTCSFLAYKKTCATLLLSVHFDCLFSLFFTSHFPKRGKGIFVHRSVKIKFYYYVVVKVNVGFIVLLNNVWAIVNNRNFKIFQSFSFGC